MVKEKISNSLWKVIFDGVKIYFSNIDKFLLYMLFPVFGQIIGIGLTFGLTLGFADKIAQKTAQDPKMGLIYIILLSLPGLLIFMKAFWDYMVAYVALNSMAEGAITTGRVYDFQSHNEVATRRFGKYIVLLFAVGILSLIGVSCCVIPIFGLIPPLIIWVYLILVFQVFTFEPELSVKECFSRSFELIKGNWGRTFIIMLILGFFSIYIITQGVTVIFDYMRLTDTVASLFDFVGETLPLNIINKGFEYLGCPVKITVSRVSVAIMSSILSVIVSELTLPIRSICYSLWYMGLSQNKQEKKNSENAKKVRKVKKDKE